MHCSVYIAVSVDGFIARTNGDVDWLEPYSQEGEDYGYADFMSDIDVLVLGRATYEKALTFGGWPYGDKNVVVLSTQDLVLPPDLPESVRVANGAPEEIVKQLREQGLKNAYIDGGVTIQRFLRSGLIDTLILSTIPTLLGDGVPLFGALPEDRELRLVDSRSFDNGVVQTRYEVDND